MRPVGAQLEHRRGSMLIVTMIVTFALASMVLVLTRTVRVEALSAANLSAEVEASAVMRGAEQYVLAMVSERREQILDAPESDFAAVPVGGGYFWVVRPDYGDEAMPLFGVVSESGKLNVNSARIDQLVRMVGMTEDIAAAIIDWRDTDSNITPGGAEHEYYLSLPDPYYCKNALFETVEEMLLVRGVTRQLLYGDSTIPLGTRWRGQLAGSMFLSEMELARGIYDYLTVHSIEVNRSADGRRRLNLNQSSSRGRADALRRLRELLINRLSAEGRGKSGDEASARANEIIASLGQGRITNIFQVYFRGNMTVEEFELIADDIATSSDLRFRGTINVNTAPREVLMCLEGLNDSDVDRMLAFRRTLPRGHTSIAWLVEEEALGQKAMELSNRITGRTYQFSADIVAVSGNGRAFKRCRMVVDLGGEQPRVRYRRDLTSRGWPMEQEILASLREGRWATGWGAGIYGTGAVVR